MGKTVIVETKKRGNPRLRDDNFNVKQYELLVIDPARSAALATSALFFGLAFSLSSAALQYMGWGWLVWESYTSPAIVWDQLFVSAVPAAGFALFTYFVVFNNRKQYYRYDYKRWLENADITEETTTETIEDDSILNYQNTPASNAELVTNRGNVPRHANPKYARDYLFTGAQWDWMRKHVQHGDLYLRRDTSPAGIGWTDLENGPPGAGKAVNERRKHFTKSTTALRKAGYIDYSGRWTRLGYDEFLELPYPNTANAQNHVTTSGDGRADGQNGGAE